MVRRQGVIGHFSRKIRDRLTATQRTVKTVSDTKNRENKHREYLLWWLLVDAAESGDGNTTVDNVSLPNRYCGVGGKALRPPLADTRGGGCDRGYRVISPPDAITEEGGVTGALHFDGGREGTIEALKGSGTERPSPGSFDVVEEAESIE